MTGIRQSKSLSNWILTRSDGNYPDATLIQHDFGELNRPKTSFLFTAEFGLTFQGDRGAKQLEAITYDLKNASRPQINVNLEDVNFDGYRAKVATRISFGTVKLTFYEDSLNTAQQFLWSYLNEISPLTKLAARGENTYTHSEEVIGGANGIDAMAYPDGPIAWIKVHHHYISGDKSKVTTYVYTNPKLESVEYSDLDMTMSEATTVTLTFAAEAINTYES